MINFSWCLELHSRLL